MKNLNDYKDVLDKCSHCSFCQATCPVYQESLLETYVAKSRANLIKEVLLEQSMPVTERMKEIVNRCLLCTNCQQTCPASIPIPEIVISARYQLYSGKKSGVAQRFVMKRMMKNRGVKGVWKWASQIGQKTGIAPQELPDLSRKNFEKLYPKTKYAPQGKVRAKVAYYVGCSTSSIYSDTGDAVMKVLRHNGVEVNLPRGLVCCGIPALGEGDIDTAREMMLQNIELLSSLEMDAIVTDCTSCGLTFKKKVLSVLGPDDPAYEKAKFVADKIYEVTDYLNHIGLSRKPATKDWKYTYHVPCHRDWSPGLVDAPRKLLKDASLVNLNELDDPQKCCGGGGSFFIEYKEVAKNIRSPKLKDIRENVADTVLTQCPLCRIYLDDGLKGEKKVMHPIFFLAQAYGFLTPVQSKK